MSQTTLQLLRELKQHSDAGHYNKKIEIFRELLKESPQDFFIDTFDKKYPGVTHRPTGFRFHAPKREVAGLSAEPQLQVGERVDTPIKPRIEVMTQVPLTPAEITQVKQSNYRSWVGVNARLMHLSDEVDQERTRPRLQLVAASRARQENVGHKKLSVEVISKPRQTKPVHGFMTRMIYSEKDLAPPNPEDVDRWKRITQYMTAAKPYELESAKLLTGRVNPSVLINQVADRKSTDTFIEDVTGIRDMLASELSFLPDNAMEQLPAMYLPHANTAIVNERSPGVAMHELGHAIDLSPRENESNLKRFLRWQMKPTLWQEYDAWQKARKAYQTGYAADLLGRSAPSLTDEEHAEYLENMESYNSRKYPAFGTYLGGAAGSLGGALVGAGLGAASGDPISSLLGGFIGSAAGGAAGIVGGATGGVLLAKLRRNANRAKAVKQLEQLLARPEGLAEVRKKLDELRSKAKKPGKNTQGKSKNRGNRQKEIRQKAASVAPRGSVSQQRVVRLPADESPLSYRHDKTASRGKILARMAKALTASRGAAKAAPKRMATGARNVAKRAKPLAGDAALDAAGATAATWYDYSPYSILNWGNPEAAKDAAPPEKGLAWLLNAFSANALRRGIFRGHKSWMPLKAQAGLLFANTPMVQAGYGALGKARDKMTSDEPGLLEALTDLSKYTPRMLYSVIGHPTVKNPDGTLKYPGIHKNIEDSATRFQEGIADSAARAQERVAETAAEIEAKTRAAASNAFRSAQPYLTTGLGAGSGYLVSSLFSQPLTPQDSRDESESKQRYNRVLKTLGTIAGAGVGLGAGALMRTGDAVEPVD